MSSESAEQQRCMNIIFADSEKNADLLYLSGFQAPDEFLYCAIPEESKQVIVVSELEFSRARAEAAPGVEVILSSELPGAPRSATEIISALATQWNVRKFHVPYHFPLGLAVALRKMGFSTLVAPPGRFAPQREFKTAAEVEKIRQALRVTEFGMYKAFELLAQASIATDDSLQWQGKPLTAELLRGAIDSAIASRNGCAVGTIAAPGTQGACPHQRGTGVIYAHTPIVIDVFPRMNDTGYFGDLTRTVVKGKAPAIVRSAFDAVRRARDETKAMLHAHVTGSAAHDFADAILRKAGFSTGRNANGDAYGFFHGLGHGVGLEIHEAPRLSPANPHILQGGEIVTVEPGVYYPEWGGIRLEDMVWIRETDAECLTQIETTLEID